MVLALIENLLFLIIVMKIAQKSECFVTKSIIPTKAVDFDFNNIIMSYSSLFGDYENIIIKSNRYLISSNAKYFYKKK